jgi:hypothetical protein
MMSKDEAEVVKIVYNRFIGNEEETWTDLDSNLEMFDWLNDKEIIKETKVKLILHAKGIRCDQEHKLSECFAPYVMEAAEAITKLYDNTKELHVKNKYILTYYLVLSELGLIYSI